AGAAVQLPQRALRQPQRLPRPAAQPLVVDGHRAVRPAPGGGGTPAAAQFGLLHRAAGCRPVAGLPAHGQHRPVVRRAAQAPLAQRGQATVRPPPAGSAMIVHLLWLLGGLVALVTGAEVLTRAGTRLAARLGIRPILIGLTIVAVGTSMPELAVGLWSTGDGDASLTVGNVVGANIMNMLLTLSLSAALMPLAIQLHTLRFDLPMMAGAALLLLALAWDLRLDRAEGVLMLVLGLAYLGFLVQLS